MEQLKDWRGNAIEVGSVILYPTRQGSSMDVCEAVVKEVGEREGWRGMQPYLTVEWIRDNNGSHSATWRKVKTVRLTVLDRVTVLVAAPKVNDDECTPGCGCI